MEGDEKNGAAIIARAVEVTRTALQNAASIAGLLLTTECIITDLPEPEKGGGGGGGHDHGGMGGMGGMM